MAAAAILYCRISKILLADGVWRAQTNYCAKFRQNRLIGCEDIKFFQFFKDGGYRHLGLSNSQNLIG